MGASLNDSLTSATGQLPAAVNHIHACMDFGKHKTSCSCCPCACTIQPASATEPESESKPESKS